MWIRSQDGKTLAKVTRLAVVGRTIQNLPATGIEDDYDVMGKYESEERAMEVLDKIENQLFKHTKLHEKANDYHKITKHIVFQMPKE